MIDFIKKAFLFIEDNTLQCLYIDIKFEQLGIESTTTTSEAFAALIREELDKWGRVIKSLNLRVD